MKLTIVAIGACLLCWLCQVEGGWIDPDTKKRYHTTKSLFDNRKYSLVFSDEFNVEGRNFSDGSDPRWTSIEKNDYTNYALHYYKNDLVTTSKGYLNITTIAEKIQFSTVTGQKTKYYKSGMIQGWNKFCFTGGIIEVNARLPGRWDIGGLWPAMWLLGNLARATYVGSSNNVWPWSYDDCKTRFQTQQAISKCNIVNHYGLHSRQGRGAPEIDILESMSGNEKLINTKIHRPYFSSSLQVAPAIQDYRPNTAEKPDLDFWYNKGIEYISNETDLNIFFYGMYLNGATESQSYLADAISANTNLNYTHFDSFHKYTLEWVPGSKGYLKWYDKYILLSYYIHHGRLSNGNRFLDGEYLFSISSEALEISGANIPVEPMYLLFNTAVSSTWGFPIPCPDGCDCNCVDPTNFDCSCALPNKMIENFPAHFLIDYVRVYQLSSEVNNTAVNQNIGCSTPNFPSSDYIKGHMESYKSVGDDVPLNPVMNGGGACEADSQCTYGSCVKHKCVCMQNYTGPTCKASAGFDDVQWKAAELHEVIMFNIPTVFVTLSGGLVVVLLLAATYKTIDLQKHRRILRETEVNTHATGSVADNQWRFHHSSGYQQVPNEDSVNGSYQMEMTSTVRT